MMPIVPLSEVEPKAMEWLWPGWLAAGCLHLLDGDPGVGKSFLTGDLAARLSTGRPWPDGAHGPNPAATILLNAEDDAAFTTHGRLTAAQADMSRVFVWRHGDEAERLRLPGRVEPLRDAIQRSGARLVVIDPVTAFLDRSVGFCSDPDVRRALAPLAELAEETHCAIVLVRHLTKSSRGRAMMAGLGSVGWIASVRLAWIAGTDPTRPGQAVLAPLKSNVSSLPASLAYRVAKSSAQMEWLGISSVRAQTLVKSLGRTAGKERQRAREFLQTFLAHGPQPSPKVHEEGAKEGFSERTLRRAARELAITLRREGNHRQVTWWEIPAIDPTLKAFLDDFERGAA